VSLISDALNEAQREANKRRKESQPALLGENPMAAPPPVIVAPPYRPWGRVLLYTAIGVVIVASAFGMGILAYRRAQSEVELRARNDSTVSPVPAPAPSRPAVTTPFAASKSGAATAENQAPAPRVVAPAASMPSPPIKSSQVATNSARPPVTTSRGREPSTPATAPAPISSRRLPVRSPGAPTAGSPSVATPAPPDPRAARQDVRVVVDPTVLRPGDSLFIRAYTEHTRGNLDGAADLYERALTKPPVSPELYNDYGALLATRGKHAAAIAMYNLGIAANDKDARLWANLGDSYRATGRRADAMSAYVEAVKFDPTNIGVRLRLAGEYASLGDTASARRGFEDAVRAAPNDAEARYRYGVFLQTQHDTSGALRELQAFVDLAPGRYPVDVIERTKAYIANLRRVNR
jgi:Tfp pilus assembly protein PilF